MKRFLSLALAIALPCPLLAGSQPVRARQSMVVTQNAIASQVGMETMVQGGNAVDAAVAAAFALAVVHPAAGNIGGGGFLLVRAADGTSAFYDFREMAPAKASPTMFLDENGRYSPERHHRSHLSVGVPGTVLGLALAWKDNGRLPWKTLLQPAIGLAREGFMVTEGLARSLEAALPRFKRYPASLAQFTREGKPYEAGDLLKQPDLARTLERVANEGANAFYSGETAELIEKEMQAHGGLITKADLASYTTYRRRPLLGSYRGYDVVTAAPPSAGGLTLLQCLNMLEPLDLGAMGVGSSRFVHNVVETLRRAFADRVRHVGDPAFVKDLPLARLVSKEYALERRRSILPDKATRSSPTSFDWPSEGAQTTHLSVVDTDRNAVSLTYTLEDSYGSGIVVPGAGFLLNNEMGDFNAGPGLTDDTGTWGTEPNLAAPGKRMVSSMTPTIVTKGGRLRLVTGSPGGRTIPSTVLLTVLNAIDFGMNAQEAVDTPRFNHQWLPDQIGYERHGLSADTLDALASMGHASVAIDVQGVAEVIGVDARGMLEGAADRRAPDGAAIGR